MRLIPDINSIASIFLKEKNQLITFQRDKQFS